MTLARILFVVVSFLIIVPAGAQDSSIKKILSDGIYQRSPLGKYEAKNFSPGVKGMTNPRCSPSDLDLLFKIQDKPFQFQASKPNEVYRDKVQNVNTKNLSIQAADFETTLINELTKMLNLYQNVNDPIVTNREICVGTGIFARPNAVSIGMGYMVFDPHLFFQIARSSLANEWSLLAVMAHEFAHQLQIWHKDSYLTKLKNKRHYVREKELQADCISTAILSRLIKLSGKKLDITISKAINDAFISLGDFELHFYESHHGTAWERVLMVEAGERTANMMSLKNEMHSAPLLAQCRIYIDAMNKKHGDELWPIGSPLE